MQIRNSARAVILNKDNAVLLFKFSFPDMTDNINNGIKEFWVTPGGGLKGEETFQDALRRELREETGLILDDNPPWIWTREVVLEWKGQKMLSHERYFLIKLDHNEFGVAQMTDNEKATLKGQRWWSLKDILSSSEDFRPPALAVEIEKILAGQMSDAPIAID